jgi:hypothetical protein
MPVQLMAQQCTYTSEIDLIKYTCRCIYSQWPGTPFIVAIIAVLAFFQRWP